MWKNIFTAKIFLYPHKDLSLGCTLCLRLYMLGHTGSAASYREGGCEDETQAALNVDFHPRL